MNKSIAKTTRIIGICAIALISSSTFAETPYSVQYQECMDNIDYGAFKNTQMQSCVDAELERQDVILNREYQLLRGSFSQEQKAYLLDAQRAWLQFRENWCQLESTTDFAPGGVLNYKFCMMSRTAEQINLIMSLQP
jgi:uncharacterized protein YecT (DUF1311 family)